MDKKLISALLKFFLGEKMTKEEKTLYDKAYPAMGDTPFDPEQLKILDDAKNRIDENYEILMNKINKKPGY